MEYKAIGCVVGAILINLTLGTFYSIGNVMPYMASFMRRYSTSEVTPEDATWITAAFLLGQGIFIIVGSFIEKKFNNRIACIVGCVLHCLSTFLTIWTIRQNFISVVLVYGFGSGLGCGSAYMASIIAAQKWFPYRKGLFTGLIVGGFGFGGLIFTNLQTLYVNPDNLNSDQAGYYPENVYDRVPNLFLYMGIIFVVSQAIGCILAFPPPAHLNHEGPASPVSGAASGTTVNEGPLPEMKSLMSTFRHRIFYIIGMMMILVAPGVTFCNSLGKRYGQMYISDDRYLATTVAIAAVANAVGRLTWGYLTDRFSFSTCYAIKVFLFAGLIITFPFGFVLQSKTVYLIWMLGLFFGFSGTFVLFPIFIEQVFGPKFHGLIYGILYLLLAASSILTSILIQNTVAKHLSKQVDPSQKFMALFAPCATIATTYILSLLLYVLATPVKKLETAIDRRKTMEINRLHGSLANRSDLMATDRGQLVERHLPHKEGSGSSKENSLGSIVRFAKQAVKSPGIGQLRA